MVLLDDLGVAEVGSAVALEDVLLDLDGKHATVMADQTVVPKIFDQDEQNLLLLADILIADYSSIMVDYTILEKPILLFAYDLEDYKSNLRDFYFDKSLIYKNSELSSPVSSFSTISTLVSSCVKI